MSAGPLPGVCSEAPFWDGRHDRLVWVETAAGALHTWQPRTGHTDSVTFGAAVGGVAPRRSGGYVVAVGADVVIVDGSGRVETLAAVASDGGRLRLNDGRCDPHGNFWTGTMAHDLRPGAGSLFRIDPAGTAVCVLDGVGISNGLGWSPDGTTMYYVDSLAGGVDEFAVVELAVANGAGRPRRTRLVDIPNDSGSPIGMTVPDGMTVDAEGHLWVAVFGAGQVRRYSPRGALGTVVEVPHPAPTSCTFGGADLGELYITTGAGEPDHIYRCRPGPRGLPPASFAG